MGYCRQRLGERGTWLGFGLLILALGLYVVWHDRILHHALAGGGASLGAALVALPNSTLGKLLKRILGVAWKIEEDKMTDPSSPPMDITAELLGVWQSYQTMKTKPSLVSELEFGSALLGVLSRVAGAAAMAESIKHLPVEMIPAPPPQPGAGP